MRTINIGTVLGSDVRRYVKALARLRCDIFRELPYLHVGDRAYEQTCLTNSSESPKPMQFWLKPVPNA